MTPVTRRVYFSDPANARRSQSEHVALVDAIAARDAKRACGLITRHMRSAVVYWRSVMGKAGAKPRGQAKIRA